MTALASMLFTALLSVQSWSHGEDRPGPNNGFIRMPGAYHTELVPVGKNQVKVFLLDIELKNPTVQASALRLTFKGKSEAELGCAVISNRHYLCSFPNKMDPTQSGKIIVKSQREGKVGMDVTYDWPLKPWPVL